MRGEQLSLRRTDLYRSNSFSGPLSPSLAAERNVRTDFNVNIKGMSNGPRYRENILRFQSWKFTSRVGSHYKINKILLLSERRNLYVRCRFARGRSPAQLAHERESDSDVLS